MRLLVCTQTVDIHDPVLGFFHAWLTELAQHAEYVTVLALNIGEHTLPDNVEVCILPRGRVRRAASVLAHAWRLRRAYTHVFVHMNPEYVAVSGWLWRLLRTRVVLWYVHRSVNFKLRVAHFFAHAVVTASKEGMGIATKKRRVIGHGIEVEKFICETRPALDRPLTIISVGRVSPIKRCEILIEAVAQAREVHGLVCAVSFIGDTDAEPEYVAALQTRARDAGLDGMVAFSGAVDHEELPDHYCAADVVVNMAPDGGMDKAVLEGIAAGRVVLAANEAFRSVFAAYATERMFRDSAELAQLLGAVATHPATYQYSAAELAENVRTEFSVRALVQKLVAVLNE